MLGLKLHDLRQHPSHHAGRYLQREVGALAREAKRDLFDACKAFLYGGQQQLALGCERESFRVSLEKRELIVILQRQNLPADGPLSEAQVLGRAREAAVAGNGLEDLEGV